MLSIVPAFVGGMPGGIELLIIFFIMFLLFGVPLALAIVLGYRYVTGQAEDQTKDERITELESELSELREQVEETATEPRSVTGSDGGPEPQAESASGDDGTGNDE